MMPSPFIIVLLILVNLFSGMGHDSYDADLRYPADPLAATQREEPTPPPESLDTLAEWEECSHSEEALTHDRPRFAKKTRHNPIPLQHSGHLAEAHRNRVMRPPIS